MTTPRIYVADLAAYNAGHLHGVWIDLTPEIELSEVSSKVDWMLDDGTHKYGAETLSVHEEYAIHDYEGFGPIRIGEYDSLETVLGHVKRMGDEPGKYYAWLEDGREPADFDPDSVYGPYESESDYFDQWLDSIYGSMDVEGVLVNAGVDPRTAGALSSLLTWIDAEQFVRDGGNLVEVPTGEYSREYYEIS